MNLSEQIKLMRELAHEAHATQTRNNGKPYITHVEAVAANVKDELKPIALGHDLVEDTNVTLEDLKKMGFPQHVITAIDLLTHKENVSNGEYWKRISVNKNATAVKLQDIKNNLFDSPSDYAKAKYKRALKIFQNAGYTEATQILIDAHTANII